MVRVAILTALFITNLVNGQTTIVEEDITIWNDSIQLNGTLSYKKESKQAPLAIFVQGSGNPDRNGNQLTANVKANYIKMLADSLTQRGIAFFRFDKRNVTKANRKHILKQYLFDYLVQDVQKIISHFSSDKRFSQIIVIGHSQGSLVGMLAINQNVDKFISLAGLGKSADKTIIDQVSAQNKQLGKTAKQHTEELIETGTIKEINPFLISLFAKQNHEFLLSYFKHDPARIISEVQIPTLIINGDKDLQVSTWHAETLHTASSNSKLVIIPNMNHVLKHINEDSENMQSYFFAEFSLATTLTDTIEQFIKH